MQTLEILIEENAFGAARPVEVAIDVPVAALISMLVEELHLPKTDLFGKRLFYKLRQMPDGRIIPEETTLRFFGISRGAKLVLDSYVLENSSFNLVTQAFDYAGAPIDLNLHNSSTLDDESAIPVTGKTFSYGEPKKRVQKTSRRAFLLLGGAVLSAGIVGTSYAAYKTWGAGAVQALQTKIQQKTAVTQNAVPARPTAPKMMAKTLPNTATATFTFQKHTQIVRSLAWSENSNMLVSGADDQKVLIWKADGTVQQMFQAGASVQTVTWAGDGQRVAVGAGNQVIFYDAQTGRRLARGRNHVQMVTSLAWARHGQMQVVSCANDMRAVVWNTDQQYQAHLTFTQHTSPIQSISWATDGNTIASASDGGVIRVWSGNTGLEEHGYYFDGAVALHTVAFAPTDSRLVAGGNDGVIRLWNNGVQCQLQAAGEFGKQCMDQPQRLQVTKSPVRSLSWSPDGRFLLSGSDDGTIALWYPGQKQTPLFTIKQNAPVLALSWSPDGKNFASTSGAGIILWLIA